LPVSNRRDYNAVMVIRGRIENGVVVFQPDVILPEGMEVSVVVPADPTPAGAKMTDA
jgi:hypothetical protein